jgi:hypothetical protein
MDYKKTLTSVLLVLVVIAIVFRVAAIKNIVVGA